MEPNKNEKSKKENKRKPCCSEEMWSSRIVPQTCHTWLRCSVLTRHRWSVDGRCWRSRCWRRWLASTPRRRGSVTSHHAATCSTLSTVCCRTTMRWEECCLRNPNHSALSTSSSQKLYASLLTDFSVSALTLLLVVRKSIRPVKKFEWWGAGMVICLERGTNDWHMVQLMPLPPPSSLSSLKSRLV